MRKVRTKFEAMKENGKYLQNLIDADLCEHNGKMGNATEGLLWLKRYNLQTNVYLSVYVQRSGVHVGTFEASRSHISSIESSEYVGKHGEYR